MLTQHAERESAPSFARRTVVELVQRTPEGFRYRVVEGPASRDGLHALLRASIAGRPSPEVVKRWFQSWLHHLQDAAVRDAKYRFRWFPMSNICVTSKEVKPVWLAEKLDDIVARVEACPRPSQTIPPPAS